MATDPRQFLSTEGFADFLDTEIAEHPRRNIKMARLHIAGVLGTLEGMAGGGDWQSEMCKRAASELAEAMSLLGYLPSLSPEIREGG